MQSKDRRSFEATNKGMLEGGAWWYMGLSRCANHMEGIEESQVPSLGAEGAEGCRHPDQY